MRDVLYTNSTLVLIALMLLLFLSACGTNQYDVDTPPYNNVTETPPINGIHPPVDLGGAVLRLGSWSYGAFPFMGLWQREPDPATATNYRISRLIWDNARRVKYEFNFMVLERVVPYQYMWPVLETTAHSGMPFADICVLSGPMLFAAILENVIVPIDTIDLPNSDIQNSNLYGRIAVHGMGHDWSFQTTQYVKTGRTIGVNMDVINTSGAPDPLTLYEQGEWTWDAMLDIMRMATQDTTGSGMISQFGIAGYLGNIITYFVGANDGRVVSDDFRYYLDHINIVEALEFVDTILREGLWQGRPNTGMFSVSPISWPHNFWAFHRGESAFFISQTWNMNYGNLPF